VRLILILHAMIGGALASVAVVVALISGISTLWPLLGAALVGWLIGWPVAIYVARAMRD